MNSTIEFTKSIHYHFADFICKKYKCHDDVCKAIVFCTSYFTANGHSCLSIGAIANKNLHDVIFDTMDNIPNIKFPSKEKLHEIISTCAAVSNGNGAVKPLVYNNGNCYLYRYWNYEDTICQFFDNKLQSISQQSLQQIPNLCQQLQSLAMQFAPEQILAQLTALTHPMCVISGGPGTGKTTVIAAIVYHLLRNNPGCHIALCAPTGKAASRLVQAIAQFKEHNVEKELQSAFPDEAYTIHRLLGYQKGELEFYYNEKNRLPYDVIIVDESSMVDIPLMAKLCRALKDNARLILVGDKDQLSSVEAGAFFGDVCWGALEYGYTYSGKKLIQQCGIEDADANKKAHPVKDSIVILQKTYRFGADSGIAALAQAIRNNDEQKALAVFDTTYTDVECKEYDTLEWLYNEIRNYANVHFGQIVNEPFEQVFNKINQFVILSPFNEGPWGVELFNNLIEKQLKNPVVNEWYHQRIIMVTANDYNLQVFNGDTGIYNLHDDAVYFSLADGYRKINPSLLTSYMPAYSITVHKSQGSEFDTVVLVLPNIDIAQKENWKILLTRELLYTAVTRARKHLIILGKKQTVVDMIQNPTLRTSGLRQRLWKS
ncbi:MAG: exodeoxyribonuclease V subunit alpha [Spirochaetes bacterium]|nr:exodeoxyribonuclease V subunit alpha [Spirochaetota bacterium]